MVIRNSTIDYRDTRYQNEKYAAAFRGGTLHIVRLADQCSMSLSPDETKLFQARVMEYELSAEDADPIDRAVTAAQRRGGKRFSKRKHVRAMFCGAIIAFEPIGEKA